MLPTRPINQPVTFSRCLALASLVASLVGPRAEAGELASTAALAVAKDPTGQRAAAVADAILRAQTARARALRLLDSSRVMSGDPRTREEETLARARTALAAGRRAYEALKLDDAIARLGQAVNLFQETGPLLGDLGELRTALAYLGAALTLRGSPDEGESTFVDLLTTDPSYELGGFPPVVLKTFERAAKRLEGVAAGAVEIYSTPPYAAVYLDGRFEGVTPLTLSDVSGGTHHLRIEKVGYATHGARLEVVRNQRITSQTRLASLKRGVELRDLATRSASEIGAPGMGGALRGLARTLTAEVLIFVGVSQSGSDATLIGGVFDTATGARLGTERAVLSLNAASFIQELERFSATLVDVADKAAGGKGVSSPDAPVSSGFGLGQGAGIGQESSVDPSPDGGGPALGSGGPPTPEGLGVANLAPPPIAKSGSSASEYIGWSLVGIGGASVITGIVFGVLAKTVHSDYRNTPQGSPDLESIRNRGKTDALVADFAMGGGILTVLGGTALLLFSRPSDPSPEALLRTPRVAVVPTREGALFTFETVLP